MVTVVFPSSSHVWTVLSYCIGGVSTIDIKCHLPAIEPMLTSFHTYPDFQTFVTLPKEGAQAYNEPRFMVMLEMNLLQDCVVMECFVLLPRGACAGWCSRRAPAVSSAASVPPLLLSLAAHRCLLSLFYKWVNCGSQRKATLDTAEGWHV